jgi:membrane associated rhomboid family serine protease
VLIAISQDELSLRRLPWLTWAIAGLWLLAFALHSAGWPASLWSEAGLVPGAFEPRGLALHWLLHESAAHLLAGLVLILAVGPALEEAWGRALLGGCLVAALAVGVAGYSLSAADTPRPLVGGSAALAALIGAFAVRFFHTGVGYTALGWWQGPVFKSFHAPVWWIAPVWFVCEVIMQLGARGDGLTRGVDYGGQLSAAAFGVIAALAVRRFDVERRLGRLPEGAPHPALAAAADAQQAHGPMAAVSLLTPAVRERPADAELVNALCESACAAGEPGHALPAFVLLLSATLQDDPDAAAALWLRWARPLGRPELDLRTRLRLAERVLRRGDGLETARLLQPVVSSGAAFTPGVALRVVELVREVHAGLALVAVARALDAPDLHEAKRAKLDALRADLIRRQSETPDPVLDEDEAEARQDRSIEIEPDEDLRRPPAGFEARPEPEASGPLGLSADGRLETTGDRFEDLSGDDLNDTAPILAATESASPPLVEVGLSAAAGFARFSDAKRVEVVPVAWETGRVRLERSDAAALWLELSRVQAVAAAAVSGLASKPVIVVDLLLSWNELEERPLQLLRWRSDRFDPARLRPELGSGLAAFRQLVDGLLQESGAVALPDDRSARGQPFRMFDGIDAYEREVLQIDV